MISNGCNCAGAMGRGIAAQFKERILSFFLLLGLFLYQKRARMHVFILARLGLVSYMMLYLYYLLYRHASPHHLAIDGRVLAALQENGLNVAADVTGGAPKRYGCVPPTVSINLG